MTGSFRRVRRSGFTLVQLLVILAVSSLLIVTTMEPPLRSAVTDSLMVPPLTCTPFPAGPTPPGTAMGVTASL